MKQPDERITGYKKIRVCIVILLVAGMLFAARYVSGHYYQLMLIQGDSMKPAYHNLQLVLIDRRDAEYGRDDVIAFRCDSLSSVLVKRIAAVPGDTAYISNGILYINEETDGFYSDMRFEYSGLLDDRRILSNDEYVVLGDNVTESIDSRYEAVGIINAADIIGKIVK